MKEKSSFVCPFCNGPIYVKKMVVDSEIESSIIKHYYCTCRGYRKMQRITDAYTKEKLRTYKACERLSDKARKYEEICAANEAGNVYTGFVNYISFALLGIKDSSDIKKGF